MTLDQRGGIAIAEIIIYAPILVFSTILASRHGFTRKAGWIFFAILSVMRIIGGITHVLAEQNPSNTTLQIIFGIMESSGLSPLLMATVGFLGTVGQYTLESHPILGARAFRLLGLLGTVAIVFAIIGGVKSGEATSQAGLDQALNLRHAAAIVFVILYALVVVVTFVTWQNRSKILKYRQKLLDAIIVSLPFLFVRVLYSLLASFAPAAFGFDADGNRVPTHSDSSLSKFGTAGGDWTAYLVMSVIMEYVVVLIYTTAGLRLPLKKDLVDYQSASSTHLRTMSDDNANAYRAGYMPSYGA